MFYEIWIATVDRISMYWSLWFKSQMSTLSSNLTTVLTCQLMCRFYGIWPIQVMNHWRFGFFEEKPEDLNISCSRARSGQPSWLSSVDADFLTNQRKAGPKNSAHLSADVQILWNLTNSGHESVAFWLFWRKAGGFEHWQNSAFTESLSDWSNK
jgi:hypothetical protein